jgi:TrpR-related protein YerC/YecD
MDKDFQSLWQNALAQQFVETLLRLDQKQIMQNFLSDVMTKKEILEISSRLQAARLLSEKVPYIQIASQTKLSSRTIARISDWMQNGAGGYEVALTNIHHTHTSPDRTD